MNKILMLAILVTVTATGCQKNSNSASAGGDPAASQTEAASKQGVDPQDSSSDDIENGDSNSEVKN